MQGDPLINLRSKEQEAELVRQTLAALTAMRIRFPGKSEEEAELVLDEVSVFLRTSARRLAPGAAALPRWIDFRAGSDQKGQRWRSAAERPGPSVAGPAVFPESPVGPGAVSQQTLRPPPPPPHTLHPHICCPRRLGSHRLSNDPADNLSSSVAPLLPFPTAPSY